MRKVLIGLAVFVFAVAVVVLVGPQLIPADRLKQDVARQVEAATGRQLTIDGDLSFTLLPAPGVSVSGVRLANIDGAVAPDMLRLRRATIVVSLIPLLGGDIEVDRIILVEPMIELEQLADGRASWEFAPSEQASGGAAAKEASGSDAGASATPAVALNNVVIRDGSLTFRSGETVETVTGINVRMVAQSLQGPFQLEGDIAARGTALRLRTAVGEFGNDRAIPVSLSAAAGGAELAINGVISGYPNEPRMAASIVAKAADAGAAVAGFTNTSAPAVLAGKETALEGALTANLFAATISVNDLTARFGDINATGALDIGVGETPRVDLVLNAGQVDLDALLAAMSAPAKAGDKRNSGGNSGGSAGSAAPDGGAAEAAPILPKGVAGSAEIKVENLLYRGGVVRQARLAAELADGALTISQLSAQLPGSSDVSLFGFIDMQGGAPAFNGQVEANSDDLRALLGWLEVDVAVVPAERLRKLTASSAIKASAENLTITDLDLAVDTMRVRGGVAVALRERPGFGIGLSLDKVNLDAYLPRQDAVGTGGKSATGAAGKAAPQGNTSGAPGAAAKDGGLSALNDFDAIVQAKIGEVTYRGESIRGVNLDATLQNGDLTLRDASVASLAGATAKFSGALNGLAGTPSADLNLSVEAANAEGLLRLAGIEAPVPIGAAKIGGTVVGDFDGLKLDLDMQALKARAKLTGTLKQPVSAPAYDLALNVVHGEAADLFALLSGEAPGATKLGAFSLSGSVAGDINSARFDLESSAGVGKATLKGALSGLATDAATGDVVLAAQHPDMTALVRSFVPDFRPALAELGPLAIRTDAKVSPQAIRLGALEGTAGPVSYKGSGDIALGGARPKLTASLATSEIIVDWFLPAKRQGSGQTKGTSGGGAGSGAGGNTGSASAPTGGQRWSREPVDLTALQAFDAEIGLSAPAISYGGIKIDTPKLAATLAEGTLDLRELSGKAFGGSFGMTGQVVAADIPRVRYTMNVADTDAAAFVNAGEGGGASVMMGLLELFFPVSSLNLVSGRLGAEIDVAAHGRSQLELVSTLDGKGTMKLTDAVVDGIDSCRVSKQLGELNGLEGFLSLIGSSRGGQTRIANFDGRYTLANGIATLSSQTVRPECGEATFVGTVDLPRWTIDLKARATFPEHKKFPGLEIEQKGPLDAPNIRLVNSNAVQQYIIGNAADSLIRKLVPGVTAPQAAPAPAPSTNGQRQPAPPKPGASTQPSAPPQPADQFNNLLKGLIKK